MSSKADLFFSGLSVLLSAGAVAVSIYSYFQIEAQVQQGAQQVALAREALRSGERNAAFLDFTTKLSSMCKSLDFSSGRNNFSYYVTNSDGRIAIVASYRANYAVPQSENHALVTKAYANLQATLDAAFPLSIWLDDEQYRTLWQVFSDFRLTFTRELGRPEGATLSPDLYHRIEALCAGTRDTFAIWYKSGRPAGHQFPTLNNVLLSTRSP